MPIAESEMLVIMDEEIAALDDLVRPTWKKFRSKIESMDVEVRWSMCSVHNPNAIAECDEHTGHVPRDLGRLTVARSVDEKYLTWRHDASD